MNSGGRKDLGLIHPKKRPGFKEVVQQVWREKKQNRQTWNVVKQKIDQSSMVCRQWSRDNVEPTESLINQKTKSLVKLQGLGDGADIEAINSLQDEVNELIELEDVRWRQKSKEDWLLHGDKNSKFFHASVNQRRKCNFIHQISDLDGVVFSDSVGIEQAFLKYYKNIFQAFNPEGVDDRVSLVYSFVNC
jgi:hypothetical protein